MNKTEVIVKLKWIKDAIACHPEGGCDFHMICSCDPKCRSHKFVPGCGCCQLAKAYINAISKMKPKKYRSLS